jgi:hypothetical protein
MNKQECDIRLLKNLFLVGKRMKSKGNQREIFIDSIKCINEYDVYNVQCNYIWDEIGTTGTATIDEILKNYILIEEV